MRIYSKFTDYYDSARGYGIDPNAFYDRSTIDMEAGCKPLLDLIYTHAPMGPRYYNRTGVEHFTVVFCGKVYYGVKLISMSQDKLHVGYFYDVESFYEYYVDNVDTIESSTPSYYRTFQYAKNPKEYYRKYFDRSVDQTRIIEALRSSDILRPVVYIESKERNRRLITIDPILRDIEFFKVVNSYEAFQEISMFVSGIMGGQSPELVRLSDNDLIKKRGFDKQSFRTRKPDYTL